MAGSTLASDAALQAQDKRLLTREWVDSNSRKSKHPRPGPSWDPQIHCTNCKDAGVKCDGTEPFCSRRTNRGRDAGRTSKVSTENTKDGATHKTEGLQEKNKWMEQILRGDGSEGYDQESTERLKEGESCRSIAEKLGGLDSGDVEDINGQDSTEEVEEDSDELGFAERLFKTCLHLFRDLWLELSALSPSPNCTRDGLLAEGLGKFYLWGDSFQDGTLDTALGQSDELREDVLKLMCQIGKILIRRLFPVVVAPLRRTKLEDTIQLLTSLSERANVIVSGSTSDADSDSDDTEGERDEPDCRPKSEGSIGRDIEFLTECLMDLVPTLEQSLPRVGKLAQSTLLTPPPAFRVSEPAFTYVRNVYDKYPRADIKLTERLGEANWQRHVKVRNRIDQVANDEVVESKGFAVTPFSEFRDSALGSSIPTHSHYAASAASHTSFVSSQADGEERSIRAPPTPAEVSAGKPFQCHICGQTLHKIRNRVDWKIHVFADLQPYICTFSTCKDSLIQFPTRKMWVDHEFDKHRVNRSWACPDCSAESFGPDEWDEHLRQEHSVIFAGPQHSIALGSAQREISQPIDEQECPMCKIIPGTTRRAFSTHVGRHMEQIALAVLPRETEDDLEGSSVATDLPIHDQRKGSKPGSGFAPSASIDSTDVNLSFGALDTVDVLDNFDFDTFLQNTNDKTPTFNASVPLVRMADEDLEYVEQMTGPSGDQARSVTGYAHKDRSWKLKCDQCPQSFSLKKDLQRHKKTHLGVNPPKTKRFHCEDCNKSFNRRDTLRKHQLITGCSNSSPEEVQAAFGSSDHIEDEKYTIKCICANEEDDGNTVLCEGCDTWQHIKCYYHSSGKVPEVHNCTNCVLRAINTKESVEPMSLSSEDKASYISVIDSILNVTDLDTISGGRILRSIQETVEHDVSHHKATIRHLIFQRCDKIFIEKSDTLGKVDKYHMAEKLDRLRRSVRRLSRFYS